MDCPDGRQRLLLALLLATGLDSTLGNALAQDVGRAMPMESQRPPMMSQGAPCPHPFTMMLTSPASQTTQYAADFPATWHVGGAVFNQTQVNKYFGHTFEFKPPEGKCCEANPGVLTVTYKALSNGSSHNSADSGNTTSGQPMASPPARPR